METGADRAISIPESKTQADYPTSVQSRIGDFAGILVSGVESRFCIGSGFVFRERLGSEPDSKKVSGFRHTQASRRPTHPPRPV